MQKPLTPVHITLTIWDTYKVVFIKGGKSVKEYSDIYFDGLVDLIDGVVEYTGDNYENDVNNAEYKF